MTRRHMPLQVEAVEQRLLRHRPLAHHRLTLRLLAKSESDHQRNFKADFFNRIGRKAAVRACAEAYAAAARPSAEICSSQITCTVRPSSSIRVPSQASSSPEIR